MESAHRSSLIDGAAIRLVVLLIVTLGIIGWLQLTPDGLLGKADAIGYAVCHRIDARSFHLGDRQLPLCVRCTGMFAGALLALIFQAYTGGRRSGFPSRGIWAVLGIFFVAFAVDGINSYLHLYPGFSGLYEPRHILRLLTGTGMGMTLALVVYPAFQQTLFKYRESLPVIRGIRDLGILLILALGMAGMIWMQNPVLLYPLALFSAGGVLAMLTMVYTMVAAMMLRIENRAETVSQLVLPFILGVGMAFLQIAALDFVRYWLTGTWTGFQIG